IKGYLFNPLTVAVGLVLGAILLLAAEYFVKGRALVDDLDKMTLKQAFYIGLFQIFSLWPGFSRSGSTIAGGMLVGLSRRASASYTFIMAVPVMFAASVYDLWKNYNLLNISDFQTLALGFVVAGIIAYLSIFWFVRYVNKNQLTVFAYYRIILAIFTILYFYR
ncbi:MAG: undecaprenyl-diphosphate phosphatase, partial [Phascolarctobacterium sp.]|nr:undecaprenyl-diphosphate phosphatase [Candidatus Phascolarctobacterium caballi]